MSIRLLITALALSVSSLSAFAQSTEDNQLVGTWRMVSATIDPGGENIAAYGENPNGLLVFTSDMHFVEVLTDADVPLFASNARGKGTDAENRLAMFRNIGFFGTYTVDGAGAFSQKPRRRGDISELGRQRPDPRRSNIGGFRRPNDGKLPAAGGNRDPNRMAARRLRQRSADSCFGASQCPDASMHDRSKFVLYPVVEANEC